jgi:thiol-disulfide isomerase/thioredoxin
MGVRSKFATRTAAMIVAALLTGMASAAGPAPSAAPAFTLPARGGASVGLESFKGKVVMLNFWASWCGPCRQEMPLLEQMHKRYSKQGFALLGVNVDAESADAEKLLKAVQVSFPILFDKDNKVSQLYNVNSMPSSVFIDRKGNVRASHRGYKAGDENEYLDQIRTLLKE